MGAFDAASKAIVKSSAAGVGAAMTAGGNAALILGLFANSGAPAAGAGRGLGALGVALLGVNAALHLAMLCKCGGAAAHPAAEQKGAVAASSEPKV